MAENKWNKNNFIKTATRGKWNMLGACLGYSGSATRVRSGETSSRFYYLYFPSSPIENTSVQERLCIYSTVSGVIDSTQLVSDLRRIGHGERVIVCPSKIVSTFTSALPKLKVFFLYCLYSEGILTTSKYKYEVRYFLYGAS